MNLKNPTISKLILILMISVLNSACSSISLAKKLDPRVFRKRTYRPCTSLEVPKNAGKMCYRYCSKQILWKKCAETELIIEDLTDPKVWEKFLNAGFVFKKRFVSVYKLVPLHNFRGKGKRQAPPLG